MILFVLTTEGEGREDFSVLYARYLLVDATEERRYEIAMHLGRIIGGGCSEVTREGVSLVHANREDDDAMEMVYHPERRLIGRLAEVGVLATVVKANFVTASTR